MNLTNLCFFQHSPSPLTNIADPTRRKDSRCLSHANALATKYKAIPSQGTRAFIFFCADMSSLEATSDRMNVNGNGNYGDKNGNLMP